MEIFNCEWRPIAEESSLTRKPLARSARFGDGYESRWGAGLNQDLRSWALRFEGEWLTEVKPIDDFLGARGAREAFYWMPPTGDGGYWVCREWRLRFREVVGKAMAELDATFEEVAW